MPRSFGCGSAALGPLRLCAFALIHQPQHHRSFWWDKQQQQQRQQPRGAGILKRPAVVFRQMVLTIEPAAFMFLSFRFVFSEPFPNWLAVGVPLPRRGWREIASRLSSCGDFAPSTFKARATFPAQSVFENSPGQGTGPTGA